MDEAAEKPSCSGPSAEDVERLFTLVGEGKAEELRALLEAGLDPDTPEPGRDSPRTALFLAADIGYLDVVRALADAGAEIDGSNFGSERTALLGTLFSAGMWSKERKAGDPEAIAATARRVAVARFLLEAGADPNHADEDGNTPLMEAARGGLCDALELLLAAGADVGAVARNGFTALSLAAIEGHGDAVRLLLDAGAPVNPRSPEETPVLSCAVYPRDQELLCFLLSRGADPAVNAEQVFCNCVYANRFEAAALFLERPVDPVLLGEPLHLAAVKGHVELARLFIRAGAPLEWRDEVWQMTPLLAAAAHGHPAVAEALMDAGADLYAFDKKGRTPLFMAQERSHLGVASDPVYQEIAEQVRRRLPAVEEPRRSEAGVLVPAGSPPQPERPVSGAPYEDPKLGSVADRPGKAVENDDPKLASIVDRPGKGADSQDPKLASIVDRPDKAVDNDSPLKGEDAARLYEVQDLSTMAAEGVDLRSAVRVLAAMASEGTNRKIREKAARALTHQWVREGAWQELERLLAEGPEDARAACRRLLKRLAPDRLAGLK
jgi:ankyrin repeat protein